MGSQHLYAERRVSVPAGSPQLTHPQQRLPPAPHPSVSSRLNASTPQRALFFLPPHLLPSPFPIRYAWWPRPSWAEQGCSFTPCHPLLVSSSGSEPPSAALRSQKEKSTHYPVGAEARNPTGSDLGWPPTKDKSQVTARGDGSHTKL